MRTWILKSEALYNSDIEGYFCSSECEKEYIAENYYYSEFDDDYYHNVDDITKINVWNDEEQAYKVITNSKLSPTINQQPQNLWSQSDMVHTG